MKSFLLSVFFVFLFSLFAFAQESKPLRILERPKPQLPEDYGTTDAQGTITLQIEFLANGQIGKFWPFST